MTATHRATTLSMIAALMMAGTVLVAHAAQERLTAPQIKAGKWEMSIVVSQSSTSGDVTTQMPEQTNTSSQCISKDNAVLYPEFFLGAGCSFTDVSYTETGMSAGAACTSAGATLTGFLSATIRDKGDTITSYAYLGGAITETVAVSTGIDTTATYKGGC
ncbi:DUF3617 domain-containing protein [Aquisalinus flavus]|uniref:DUF3617 family protein n=1 Tax=Aquisalinus flavus TaxID=1526572 RepID=A0A8J2V4N9_9PROT|nr:DUF3617 family protein [Aquisalinus flavus]MBD0427132.1 DUF3617 family protein [Aquisalinus flavus]UNE46952.1 DUF3617 family protein [Aquisalinus flavus]GGC98621.1 hypothetical protein GCM10011342_04450 [Aquisalinus flavus]